MNEALKVIEAQVELVYNELRRVAANLKPNDKSYAMLREAGVDAINLKRKIQDARYEYPKDDSQK